MRDDLNSPVQKVNIFEGVDMSSLFVGAKVTIWGQCNRIFSRLLAAFVFQRLFHCD